jgi:hypothetical protein
MRRRFKIVWCTMLIIAALLAAGCYVLQASAVPW